MFNEQILFDTTDYNNYYEVMKDEYASDADVYLGFQEDLEYERVYAVERLNSFIKRYEKRYKTNVSGILLMVERIQPVYGGRRIGYRLIENADELFDTDAEDMRIYIDEDGHINADYFDHDGTNYSKLKLIPESAEDAVMSNNALDYADYFQKRGQLKPTKFWENEEKPAEVRQVVQRGK